MATPLAELGQNTEIDENSNGETIIRNTQTGTEIRLADFIDIAGPIGDSSDPVAGTSHFESVNTGELSRGNGTLVDQGVAWTGHASMEPTRTPDDVSATSYTDVTELIGRLVHPNVDPEGITLKAALIFKLDSITNGETVDLRPIFIEERSDGGSNFPSISSLEVTGVSSTNIQHTGFVDIEGDLTTDPDDANIAGFSLQVKVSGGTATFDAQQRHGIVFKWEAK